MSKDYAIHWFRRDLRIAGNQSLQSLFKEFDGQVVGLFCFDKKFLARKDFSVNRFQLFLESLENLKNELKACGSDLLFLDVGPEQAFAELLKKLKDNDLKLPSKLSFNRDYEPFARARDEKILRLFEKEKISTQTFRDHLLAEPNEVTKDDSTEGYKVFTPFSRKWNDFFRSDDGQLRIKNQKSGLRFLKKAAKGDFEKVFKLTWRNILGTKVNYPDNLNSYISENKKLVDVSIPETGSKAVLCALELFNDKLPKYGDNRDFPDLSGTSRFSMYLKNGSLTVPQIIAYYDLKPYSKKSSNKDTFLSELIWREFYYHILYRYPEVEKEAFVKKYDKLKWDNNKKNFEAWKNGETGYPIVDAGMRELNTTGWMHNRVRMIVASFLTKHLLIDWRWGEKYFMDKLLDGDLAPNNGGWQWAASTGCDAQPYFRIFNPWLQSKRFDKEGSYIKMYVPELKDLESKKLHEPILGHKKYPKPIVEHSERRKIALERFKSV